MISCEDLTQFVSESMDRKLSLRQRIGVRVHLSMCTFCRRFKEQVSFMRELVDLYKTAVENDYAIDDQVTLSVEFRENVKKLLRNN
jgi:predicted anti-sigma-YlaC factor YlaD